MAKGFESFNHADPNAPNSQNQGDLQKKVQKTYLRKFVGKSTKPAARPNRVDIRAAVRKRFGEDRKDKREKESNIKLRDRLKAARAKHS